MTFSNLNVPPVYLADLNMYCLHLLSYPDSLIHLWCCVVFPARRCFCCVASNCFAMRSYSGGPPTFTLALINDVCLVPNYRKGRWSLYLQSKARCLTHLFEVRSDCDVDSLLFSERLWHVFLLKYNCWIKQGFEIIKSVKFWALSKSYHFQQHLQSLA